jgi:hypothetical protein
LFIVLSLFLLYLFLVGYGVRSFLKVGGGLFEQTALRLGVGILVNYCLVLSGQPFARVFAAGGLIALWGARGLWKDRGAWRGWARENTRTIFSISCLVGLAVVCGLYYVEMLSDPIRQWDARSIWFFHARMIWIEGALRQQAGWNHPSVIVFANPDYPKLVPSVAAQLAYMKGYWNEFLPKGSLLVMLAPVMLWTFSFQRRGLSFVLLILSFFLSLGFWLTNGYMDWYLALYCGVALLSLGRYASEQRATDLYSAICALGIAASIKYEGILFTVCLIVTLAVVGPICREISLRRLANRVRTDWSFAITILLAVAPTLLWALDKRAWGLQSALARNPSGSLAAITERLFDGPTAEFVLRTMMGPRTGTWTVFEVLVVIGMFTVGRGVTLSRGALVSAGTSVLYCCALYAIYLSTPDVTWHLYTSVYRTMMVPCVAFVVATFFLLLELEEQAAHEMPRRSGSSGGLKLQGELDRVELVP